MRNLLQRVRRALVLAKCRFCAGNTATSDGKYRKKADANHKHWAVDKVDYWPCGLTAKDRRLMADINKVLA